ncbi:MAG: hypothetical protein KGD60_05090 [Candidatus Thorarchaeota archaeon]|nr:hypothetical protein [Candidatus Thorarchaeota archaeon]
MDYDAAIVGSGPAGIFWVLDLIEHKPDLKIVIIERGKSIEKRTCPNSTAASVSCLLVARDILRKEGIVL